MTITTIKDFPRKIKEVEKFWLPRKVPFRCCWNTCPTASATAPMCAMR